MGPLPVQNLHQVKTTAKEKQQELTEHPGALGKLATEPGKGRAHEGPAVCPGGEQARALQTSEQTRASVPPNPLLHPPPGLSVWARLAGASRES